MATIYWLGTADPVAQVGTVTITAFDAATTYTLTVGGRTVSCTGDTDTTLTATALTAAWNASTDHYFTVVTANSAAAVITLTADVEGVPFITTSSVAGGAGTIGAYSATTASSGPNDWSTATNWSGGAVPVNDDDVIIANSDVNICWGLDQSAVALDSMTIPKTYEGRIGLDYTNFAITADGATSATDPPTHEYRDVYLKICVDKTTGPVSIGEHFGPGEPIGSSRLMLNLHTTAAEVVVHDTAVVSADTGRPAVRLLADSATTYVYIRYAPGGVGIAAEIPGETSEVREVQISDTSTASRVFSGDGLTIHTWAQTGGDNVLQAVTVNTLLAEGGVLQTEGDYTLSTLYNKGATVNCNHTGDVAITTAHLEGGTTDATGSKRGRTWTTVHLHRGATLIGNDDALTITTLNEPDGEYTITCS